MKFRRFFNTIQAANEYYLTLCDQYESVKWDIVPEHETGFYTFTITTNSLSQRIEEFLNEDTSELFYDDITIRHNQACALLKECLNECIFKNE